MGGLTCGGCGAREGGRRGLGPLEPAVSGGSPGNYLLNANFAKDGRRGAGALVSGLRLCVPSAHALFGSDWGGVSEGLHDFTFCPGTCRSPHLGADPLAGPWAGSSRQGRGRSWPRSGDPGCLPPEWRWKAAPRCAPGITEGGSETAWPPLGRERMRRPQLGRLGRSLTGPPPCSAGKRSAFRRKLARESFRLGALEPSRMVSWVDASPLLGL